MDREIRNDLIADWYQTYCGFLHRYAAQFIDPHSAEEIVQETFRVVCETKDLQSIRNPKAWLRKIACLTLQNWLRERQRWRAMLTSLESLPEYALGQHTDAVNIEFEYEGLLKPEQLRLLSFLASGYTYADAAKAFNTSAEACRKRAKRAEKLLEEKLQQSGI